ncbi:AraC family transcriptional regulator [Paenibacillus chitinolyticus]|uniref:AraC family transcriptional regulator n=1 Tax=Paenibacillus chitinolyticus TaxID=79263 RepID=A0A410WSC1_9BACL|nr:AraC family transcriptional regulator [Paenibacillus chitinolyticus]
MPVDVLLIISHQLKEDEFERVQRLFSHMSIIAESDFKAVERSLHRQEKAHKLFVFLSFDESLPEEWKIEELQLQSPIMVLLKVNKRDLFVFYSFLDSVGLLSKPSADVSAKPEISPMLYQSLEYIEQNLCENDLSLEKVASSIFVSRCHYSRMFKEYFGFGFKEYVMNKRIQKAKAMLQKGVPVTDVCYAVGYGDLTHFGRVFKRLVGINPSVYRGQRREAPSCG